jgi:hypothetical protein
MKFISSSTISFWVILFVVLGRSNKAITEARICFRFVTLKLIVFKTLVTCDMMMLNLSELRGNKASE